MLHRDPCPVLDDILELTRDVLLGSRIQGVGCQGGGVMLESLSQLSLLLLQLPCLFILLWATVDIFCFGIVVPALFFSLCVPPFPHVVDFLFHVCIFQPLTSTIEFLCDLSLQGTPNGALCCGEGSAATQLARHVRQLVHRHDECLLLRCWPTHD